MLTKADAAQRVARGAAHLDQVRPGWAKRIDVGTLTLHDPCGCIVGQLCSSRAIREWWSGEAFFSDNQLRELGLVSRAEDPGDDDLYEVRVVRLGFDIDDTVDDDDDSDDYAVLQDAWIEAIAARLDPVEALAPEEEKACAR